MTPDFEIIAAGINITPQIRDRLLSLEVTDEAGGKADEVTITLDDRNNELELPLPGAPLIVAMGYEETVLVPMGIYTADEVVAKGPPDTIIIRGKAANLGGSVKEQKTRAWEDQTLEQIVAAIAGEHKLQHQVAEGLRDFHYEHLDQTDESDVNFLTRIAKEHDAISTVKGDTVLFMGKGEGKTAAGLTMPPVPIQKSGKLSWAMSLATLGDFKSIEANWHNQDAGTRDKVTAGEGSPVKRLRHTFPNKKEAERAAKSKLEEIKRGNNTLSITMPGEPLLAAEMQILAIGFRIGVSGTWSIKSARHTIRAGWFTTKIETEKPKS